jgi:hypothetical protein
MANTRGIFTLRYILEEKYLLMNGSPLTMYGLTMIQFQHLTLDTLVVDF